jgi:GNAT superfamily N-acetyltransferase
MSIVLQGEIYEFSKEVRITPSLREGFIQLALETFGINFRSWYENGYWGDAFAPYVLTFQGKVVASVCVNLLFERSSNKKLFVQLGGVITAKEHRGRGLSRWLLQTILEEWRNKANGIYLFANDSVLDFYPKFGFEKYLEYEFSMLVCGRAYNMRKLNPLSEEDIKLLKHCYALGNPYAAFQVDYFNLIMFYALNSYKDCIYYLPEQQTVIMAKREGDTWLCSEILGNSKLPLTQLIGCLSPGNPFKVRLGFQPQLGLDYLVQPLHEEDTTFFVLQGKEPPFTQGQGRMPELSRA